MNNTMEKERAFDDKTKEAISGALEKLKKAAPSPKGGVDLVSITKKLSSRKFGKKK